MLITIAVILIILWALGLLAFPVLGWFIHILLVIAIILILIRLIQGRNPIA
ncbi:MAG: lmo0937 family membrane protein [Candidatus Pacebacteria bacterium]|nr:lmo0937 family membrane protein [Candidatus Paceibacterota bacterium]